MVVGSVARSASLPLAAASLLITVPNQYVSVPGGTATLPKCDAQIHPVVAGTSGGLN